MKIKSSTFSGQQGFSLVELLVVIAVIGIIAAIAIPNIANITSNATYAKNQRNAQNIASVANAAIAAGYVPTWTADDAGSMVTTFASGTAVTVTNNGNVMSFSVSQLSTTEQTGATNFLKVVGTGSSAMVDYVAAGVGATN